METGHRLLFSGKEEKKNSAITLPCLDCLASIPGRNETLSGLHLLHLMSSWDRSADLDGRVRASSITVF